MFNYVTKFIDAFRYKGDLDEVVEEILPFAKRVVIAGNGGSFANGLHFAQDLIKACGIDAIVLGENTAMLTAYANDISYEDSFVEMYDAIKQPGDVLFLISTSGTSRNIVKLVDYATDNNIISIGLTGVDDNYLYEQADFYIPANSKDIRIIESAHSLILHYIIDKLSNGKSG